MEPLSWVEIFGQIFVQFTPVWMAMAAYLCAISHVQATSGALWPPV